MRPRPAFFSPGRLNIIGEHTDYSDGFVMPAPLANGIYFTEVADSKEWDIISDTTGEIFKGNPFQHWEGSPSLHKFCQALGSTARDLDLPFTALEGKIISDLPPGNGLSSSTALMSVMVAAQQHFNDWEIDRVSLARITQEAEMNMGIQCGFMDQFCMWNAAQEQAMLLDCKTLQTTPVDIHVPGFQWYLVLSGIRHTLQDSPYNQRRAQLFAGLAYLKSVGLTGDPLRSMDPVMERAIRTIPHEIQRSRVRYVREENARVMEMARALDTKNASLVARLLNEAQEGMAALYDVSCPEIDLLVRFIRQGSPDAGVRMVGGGFGGAVLVFIPEKDSLSRLNEALMQYEKRINVKTDILPVKLNGPVRYIEDGSKILSMKNNPS